MGLLKNQPLKEKSYLIKLHLTIGLYMTHHPTRFPNNKNIQPEILGILIAQNMFPDNSISNPSSQL